MRALATRELCDTPSFVIAKHIARNIVLHQDRNDVVHVMNLDTANPAVSGSACVLTRWRLDAG
jgi:hypothetical protein